MNKQEIQKSSQKKVQAVNNLMRQLDLVPSAEQMITPEGFIKHIVYFTDTEKYDIAEEKPKEELKKEVKKPKKNDKEKQNTKQG